MQVIGVAFIIVASSFGLKSQISLGTGCPQDTLNLAKTEKFAK
jgi:hypothetical protein